MGTKVYAGRLKSKDILYKSSSGGAFTALSDYCLSVGYGVVCATYNYDTNQSEYVVVTTKQDRDDARGSKYMQSKPGEIFKLAYYWIQANPDKKLLFVGMGCQADGFRKFAEAKGFRNQAIIVDIVCHGTPSPKIWRDYASNLGKIDFLSFKDKRNGWNHPTAIAVVSGKEHSLSDYVKVFYNQCALRPSCYECPYATTERLTDITIGDFWHIEDTIPDFYDPLGTSVFLVNTNKGMDIWNQIKETLDYRESNVEECWQENLEHPTGRSPYREKFWDDYNKRGIKFMIKKYGQEPFDVRMKQKIKSILGKI